MVDKYAVKDYVSKIIGTQYVIPLIGVWDNPKDIEWEKLPEQFVLKVTHGGGNSGVVVCKDKSQLNKKATIYKLSRCMTTDGSIGNKEWPYKNVKRRIIAEKYMEDLKTKELRDYKFFCFNGEPKILEVVSGRNNEGGSCFDFYDMDFNKLDIVSSGHSTSEFGNISDMPSCFEEMKSVARQLSVGIPHVRMDFYQVNGQVYFGEYTFFHRGGAGLFIPNKWNKIMGDWINLPQ